MFVTTEPSFDPQPKAQAFSAFDRHRPEPSAAGQTIESLIPDRVRYMSVNDRSLNNGDATFDCPECSTRAD